MRNLQETVNSNSNLFVSNSIYFHNSSFLLSIEFSATWFSFNSKQTLTVHVRIHHKHMRHVCDVCAKEYTTVSGLLYHLRSHTDAGRRIKCKLCGELFSNGYRLQLHQAKVHETATPLQCPHCPKKKTNQFQLKKHIAHSHNYRVHKCNLCEREFRSPLAVSVRIRCSCFLHIG